MDNISDLNTNSNTIRVLIADDHLLFREGILNILRVYGDVSVVGQASGGKQAIEMVRRLMPNVVLLDIGMPGIDGFQVCQEIRRNFENTKVVILTESKDIEYQVSAVEAGASAYLTKNAGSDELIDTIRKVFHEGTTMHPVVADRINQTLARMEEPNADGASSAFVNSFASLSRREREILQLVAEGKANKAIAHELHISEHTVRNHISNIFQKLNVGDRTEASVQALRHGVIK